MEEQSGKKVEERERGGFLPPLSSLHAALGPILA